MRPLAKKVWRDALHLRGQLAAIVLVVAAGVALFVTLRSMHGYLIGARDGYYRTHRFADLFVHLERAPESLARRLAAIPGVAALETRLATDVLLDVPGLAEPAAGRLVSIDPLHPALDLVELRSGRLPAPDRDDEILVSDAFARANGLHPGDALAAVLEGRWARLRVAGTAISPEYVYEIRPGEIFPDRRRFGVLWMQRAALARALDLEGSFDDVTARLAPGAVADDMIARLDRLLAPYGGTGAYGRGEQLSHRFLTDEIAETRVTSLLLPGVFLAVTAFLLHLVLSRLIQIQREQIAVLKAFGYSNRTIALHYVELALVPWVLGAVAGTALGLWFATALAGVYARYFEFPAARFVPDLTIPLVAAGTAAAAVLSGALAAVGRAFRLPPAEAMRPESPASFRAGLLDRSPLGRRLPVAARSVLRNLVRRPWKALVAVTGTAFAVAIVFTGRAMWDSVTELEQIQFERVEREDVRLGFRHATASVRDTLAGLDGVLRVEPLRTVAAQVRAGTRTRRVAVLGLDRDGQLWQILDRAGVRRGLPVTGALLSRALADALVVRPGDDVELELLEGERRSLRVRCQAVVDELLGMSVYFERAALHRLLGEDDRWSGALLRVDRRAESRLLRRLAHLPNVAVVSVKRFAVANFESTLAESFSISIFTLLTFACVIAVAIVYNGGRVALSERGRELASLRVLGFSRREVAAILLGEQGLLVLLALPAGLAIAAALCWLVTRRFDTELYRMPLVLRPATAVVAFGVVGAAAAASAWLVRRRLDRLDLTAVLKARE